MINDAWICAHYFTIINNMVGFVFDTWLPIYSFKIKYYLFSLKFCAHSFSFIMFIIILFWNYIQNIFFHNSLGIILYILAQGWVDRGGRVFISSTIESFILRSDIVRQTRLWVILGRAQSIRTLSLTVGYFFIHNLDTFYFLQSCYSRFK